MSCAQNSTYCVKFIFYDCCRNDAFRDNGFADIAQLVLFLTSKKNGLEVKIDAQLA